jgi:electron transport complex protein RnfB
VCLLVKRPEWFRPWVVIEKCVACNICIQACPLDCLAQGQPQGYPPKGFPLLAQPKMCIGCHLCDWACPVGAILPEPKQETARAKA